MHLHLPIFLTGLSHPKLWS